MPILSTCATSNPANSSCPTTQLSGMDASAPGNMYLAMKRPHTRSSYCNCIKPNIQIRTYTGTVFQLHIKRQEGQTWNALLSPAICRRKSPSSWSSSLTCCRNAWKFFTPTCSAISMHEILLYLLVSRQASMYHSFSHNCFYYTSKPECVPYIPDDNQCTKTTTPSCINQHPIYSPTSHRLQLVCHDSPCTRKWSCDP